MPPETPSAPAPGQLGENVCPDCGGRGLGSEGAPCGLCNGSGIVLETVGDA